MVSLLCTFVLESLSCYLIVLRLVSITKFIKMSDILFCPQSKTPAWWVGLQQIFPRSKINKRLKAHSRIASQWYFVQLQLFQGHSQIQLLYQCLGSDSLLESQIGSQFAKLFSFECQNLRYSSSKRYNKVRIMKY